MPPQALLKLRILWGSLFSTTMIFLVVLQQVRVSAQASNAILVPMFAVEAVAVLAVSVFVPVSLLRKTNVHGGIARQRGYQTAAIFGYALTESVALDGFVLAFLGFSPMQWLPFFGVAWTVFLLRFPRATHPLGFLGPAA